MTKPCRLDFNANIWSDPVKKALVRGHLSGKKVTYHNGWKIGGKAVLEGRKSHRLKTIFLQIAHWLKSTFSPHYRHEYRNTIKALTKLQQKSPSLQKTQRQANTVIRPTQPPPNHGRLQEIDHELQEIAERIDQETKKFAEKKATLLQERADYEVGKENIQTYLTYRKEHLNPIKTFFNRQQAEKMRNCLHILSELDHIQADLKALPIQDLERLLRFHEEGIGIKGDELRTEETAFRNLEKELDEQTAALNTEKDQLNSQNILSPQIQKGVTSQVELAAPLPADLKSNIHAKAFFNYLRKNGSTEFAKLWEKLLNNFAIKNDWNFIKSFSCSKNNCVLTFNEPISIWISSLNENGQEDPPGGVIFVFGNNDQNTFTFTMTNKVMNISGGYQMLVKTPEWAVKILKWFMSPPAFLTAHTTRIDFKNLLKVGITAKAYKKSKTREKTIKELQKNWGSKAEVIAKVPGLSLDQQNRAFIEKKARRT
ncbi:MAG: hypothetical protein ACSNEK_03850 [Parachlamydiaceae bacterium]